MTYVITQPCIGVKDASCVDVCPVDCIHPTTGEAGFEEAEMLYINPDECIDCGACEPACPVTAIFEEWQLPKSGKTISKSKPISSKSNITIPGQKSSLTGVRAGMYLCSRGYQLAQTRDLVSRAPLIL